MLGREPERQHDRAVSARVAGRLTLGWVAKRYEAVRDGLEQTESRRAETLPERFVTRRNADLSEPSRVVLREPAPEEAALKYGCHDVGIRERGSDRLWSVV